MMVTYARDNVPGFNEVKPVCEEDIKKESQKGLRQKKKEKE